MTTQKHITRRDTPKAVRKLALYGVLASSLVGCWGTSPEIRINERIVPKAPVVAVVEQVQGAPVAKREVPKTFKDAIDAVKAPGFRLESTDPVYVTIAFHLNKSNDNALSTILTNPNGIQLTTEDRSAYLAALQYFAKKGDVNLLDIVLDPTGLAKALIPLAKEAVKELPATAASMTYVLRSQSLVNEATGLFKGFYSAKPDDTVAFLSQKTTSADLGEIITALTLLSNIKPDNALALIVVGISDPKSQIKRAILDMPRKTLDLLGENRQNAAKLLVPLRTAEDVQAYSNLAANGQVAPLIPKLNDKESRVVYAALDGIELIADPKQENKELKRVLTLASTKSKDQTIRDRAKDILAKLTPNTQ